MTEADLEKILGACHPTIVMKIGSYEGSSPQENANRAWAELGQRMGFDHMTAQPRPGLGNRFFTAVPNETETQRAEREAKEKEAKRQERIKELGIEISTKQQELSNLTRHNEYPLSQVECRP
jgi:hypothetical protein